MFPRKCLEPPNLTCFTKSQCRQKIQAIHLVPENAWKTQIWTFYQVKMPPKWRKSTNRDQNLISSYGGQDTSECKILGLSSNAFFRKWPETLNLAHFTKFAHETLKFEIWPWKFRSHKRWVFLIVWWNIIVIHDDTCPQRLGQTDRQTDRQTDKGFHRAACHDQNTIQGMGTLDRPNLRSKLYIQWSKHKFSIINKVHAPTKANNCTKYEQDPWNIVGYWVVMNQNSKQSGYWS